MNRNLVFFYTFLWVLTASSCDNKVEINAPYNEIPIVYGMIDVSEDQHYIRIEKAFQNSDNLSSGQITQIPDSLYFDTLVVKLYDAKNPASFVTLERYDGAKYPKDSGTFSTLRNTLYTTLTLPTIRDSLRLEIFNPKSGKTYTATTKIIRGGDFTSFGSNRNIAINESPSRVIQYVFNKGENAYMYDMFIRLYYKEMNASDTTISVDKTLDFYLAKGYLADNNFPYRNNSSGFNKIPWIEFLRFLPKAIKRDDSKVRRVTNLTYSAYGGSRDFADLQELSKPVVGFVQRNTEYSNIKLNGKQIGIGIFTSRNYLYEEQALIDSSQFFIAKYGPNFIY
jgi:hypothetical protein